ncbi:shikimate dehydrogenase [Acetobacter orleanensis]|uniref:Shikimate dehydrogenase (NADP(+)) n=1 Tax=Acetobacter orleanensis TaxID=104099 RepID=A0A4Y3TLU7_9PROT|nr:shikimate dehydrogenase [Acetobacter orleanensis]KXV62811.1 shikimate dehydrogenase [Acetobacter orleanensis]PCD80587.1 shikimate dehydrogenase [Acetobacter orleanensis]GAN68099.1 shikimate 5-dehydrogenase [Acetobacter orleanensis JCM 7639]GEB81977.1 shikimate dehydrogenase (NADP(+)) [Acetobacter orleanensis]
MTKTPDSDSAPLQIITGKARLAGVLGWPVSHSRSPALHNYWLRRYGIDGAYVPLPVRPDQFEAAVRGLQAAGFRGANVTIPHKEAACALADELDPSAQRAGAVNTLVFEADGRIRGLSTDGSGFVASLEASGLRLPASGRALLLGAGGAARSVAAALQDGGVQVAVTNRTQERADTLARLLPGLEVVPWAEWEAGLGGYDLLVNTTSLGMEGGPDPLFCPSLKAASQALVVADIVYVPRQTPLLAEAAQQGLKTLGGLGMLLHQARLGFREWFGQDPVVDAQTEAALTASL